MRRVDSILAGASLLSMDTTDNPGLRAKRELNYEERFLREVEKGITAADLGKLVDHSDVRDLIDERYPG
jgi:hypothetical protein